MFFGFAETKACFLPKIPSFPSQIQFHLERCHNFKNQFKKLEENDVGLITCRLAAITKNDFPLVCFVTSLLGLVYLC